MLQLGTHRDYENPPNCPMVGRGGKKKPEKKFKLVEALTGIAEGVMKAFNCQGIPTLEKKKLQRPLTFPKESHQANVFICVVSILEVHTLFAIVGPRARIIGFQLQYRKSMECGI